jgi:hypothetical protein
MISPFPYHHRVIIISWILCAILAPGWGCVADGFAQNAGKSFETVRQFAAPEAVQGVAVDERYFYAIANRSIGKYDKKTGQRVKIWKDAAGGPFIHLDSGVVIDGLLYCAHSNFPATPMTSSIEIFDTTNLTHVGSHSFGIFGGSATWIDRWDGYWWVAFAHYAGNGGEPGKGPGWTTLMKFDPDWRCVGGYAYPASIIEKFGGMSNSGGSWGDDGLLYITGHDNAEIYALSLPVAGSVLVLEDTFPVSAEGQGIAWDRNTPGAIYTIIRSKSTVVVSQRR